MTSSRQIKGATLSIGALSKATGIPSETLRTWERRYGFPQPERSPGGHRIYMASIIEELTLIQEAMQQGFRAKQVINVGEDALRALLGREEPSNLLQLSAHRVERSADSEEIRPAHEFGDPGEQVNVWLDMGRQQNERGLNESLQRCWFMCGSMMFLHRYAARLVTEVGESWARGELSVGEEHFISERVRDFLTSQWRPMSSRAQGARMVCANLPGERHTLGLHMAATVMALHGCKIVFLGADVPLADLVEMSQREGARALCLSMSVRADAGTQLAHVSQLRAQISPAVELLLGGGGAQRLVDKTPADVLILDTLIELEQWLITARL